MDVAETLLAQAQATGARSLAVVGTSKNAGKSVVVAALAEALWRTSVAFGICSIGRDGEAADALDGSPKPRFFLRPGATLATAASLVPRSPALELLAVTDERSAVGRIVLARVRAAGYVELAGPPSALALRRIARRLGSEAGFVLIDGAVDRIAALGGGEDAIVVAVGAAAAPTLGAVLDGVAALVARLRLPCYDPAREALFIPGALTTGTAANLLRTGEGRQVVVQDGTRIALGGRAFLELAARLDLRCERPLRPLACTVAPLGPERGFAPVAFARAVAKRTGLACYDIFANTRTEVAA